MTEKLFRIGKFSFAVSADITGDPLSAIEVWVFFMEEPCCDDNGHQYRFFLPAGIRSESLKDVCVAFTKALHCEQFNRAA